MKRVLVAALVLCSAGASWWFSGCSKKQQAQPENSSADKSRAPRTAANLRKGSFKVTFDGGEGISIQNGGAPEQKENLEADSHMDATTTVSLAPHAMLMGVCVPKFALGLGTESGIEPFNKYVPSGYADRVAEEIGKTLLNTVAKDFVKEKLKDKFKTEASAYIQVVTVFTMTAAGSLSLVPCKLQRITVLGQAGADATILGQQPGEKKIDLFKKTYAEREPDTNACGEK